MINHELEHARAFYAIHEPGDATRYEVYVIVTPTEIAAGALRSFIALPRSLWERHMWDVIALPRPMALEHHFISYLMENMANPNPHTALAILEVVCDSLGGR